MLVSVCLSFYCVHQFENNFTTSILVVPLSFIPFLNLTITVKFCITKQLLGLCEEKGACPGAKLSGKWRDKFCPSVFRASELFCFHSVLNVCNFSRLRSFTFACFTNSHFPLVLFSFPFLF